MENIEHAIIGNLTPRLRDLLEIAAYVYLADTETSRGTESDVWNMHWNRGFRFVVPVADPNFWATDSVQRALTRTLQYSSGDRFTFDFVQGSARSEQLFIGTGQALNNSANSVCLFSGGADSLTGALYATHERGLTPLLVSHRSHSRMHERQRELRRLLNDKRRAAELGPLGHVSVWAHRKGAEARETTQRTRGFLFLTLGAVIAGQLNLPTVLVPENGPVSVNPPRLRQSYGTTLSRTTHPQLLRFYQEFFDLLTGGGVLFENPFIFETRTDVLNRLAGYSAAPMLQETISCASTQRREAVRPHCGTCSQCIDRRFSVISAGLETHDDPARYALDMFTEAIPEGIARLQVEAHGRLAVTLRREGLAPIEPDLMEAATALPGSAADNFARLGEMFGRYADQTVDVLQRQIQAHAGALVAGTLPPGCALRLYGGGEHLVEPGLRIIAAVGDVLERAWPTMYQRQPPQNETVLQDGTAAVLAERAPNWMREAPTLPFTVVRTTPDFAQESPRVFIEVKYVRTRARVNAIVTEITSRIQIYRSQGAAVLFAVFDPDGNIANRDRFAADLATDALVRVRIIR